MQMSSKSDKKYDGHLNDLNVSCNTKTQASEFIYYIYIFHTIYSILTIDI